MAKSSFINMFIIIVFLVCSGSNTINQNHSNTAAINPGTTIYSDMNSSISQKANEIVLKMEETTDVVSINTDNELLLAFKVKQFDKLRLKSIEKKVKDKLKKAFPKHQITASSDLKIFIEVSRLHQKVTDGKIDNKKFKKRFKEIKNLSQEQT
ncbi:YhcN/YlaJ family sporulation lipoprotein [Fredinandcohnia humi]